MYITLFLLSIPRLKIDFNVIFQKKIFILELYLYLHLTGRRKISKFIEEIIKPYVTNDNLKLAYQTMAKDKQREIDAYEWEEGLINDDFN